MSKYNVTVTDLDGTVLEEFTTKVEENIASNRVRMELIRRILKDAMDLASIGATDWEDDDFAQQYPITDQLANEAEEGK